MAEKSNRKKKIRINQSVDRNKLIELYEMIQNYGIDFNPKRFMGFMRRDPNISDYDVMMTQILTKLVDIINDNARIKMDLSCKLTPIRVSAKELIKKSGGYNE